MDIQKILEDHLDWLAGNGGAWAYLPGVTLRGADLRRAHLSRAYLCDADLRGANLGGANLGGANLRGAALRGANLSGANLSEADLRGANLSGADLSEADPSWADLYEANLSGANLSEANLSEADLSGADLRGANLTGTKLPDFQIPQNKDLKVWKKLADGLIAELLIPKEAKRTASLVGDKCRAEYAMVVAIHDGDGHEVDVGYSMFDDSEYVKGQIVRPDSYDDDPRIECTHGIHFFMDRAEAENYGF